MNRYITTRLTQGVVVTALGMAVVAGTAGSASAASYTSRGYLTQGECQAAQRAWQSSWTKVTRSCYRYLPSANGITLGAYAYRFEGVTR